MSANRARVALLLLAALAVGCSRDEPANPTPAKGVTGTVSKGPLQGASVEFFNVDIAGNQVGTTPITTVATDALGQFSVGAGILPAGVPVLAVTSSGSYVDESDPEADPVLRRKIVFEATEHLEAVLPPDATTVAITPYSMALLKKARIQANGANFANVYEAVRVQATAAFGFDPITTTPADPLTGAGGSQAYGLLLGAAALTINRIAGTATPAHMPDYPDVLAFVFDFAVPPLDAADLDEMIRRFRNNNIGVYGDVAAPTVDQVALAQPADVPNSAPTISDVADQVIAEDGATGTLSFAVDDVDEPGGSLLTVTASSDNPALVPLSSITLGGTGINRTVAITPVAGQFGSATVTLVVEDSDGGTAADAIALTVNSVNDVPTLDPITNPAAISEDAALQSVSLAGITAGDGESDTLSVTATSDNTGLIPNPVVGYTSPSATGSLGYTPVANASGTALITVTVSDGTDTATQAFTVTVDPVNDPPTLDAIANPAAINEGAGLQSVSLGGITAGGGETQTLSVTATSDNTGLIPNPVVSYTSPSATGSLGYTPVANASGTAVVTVSVFDGVATTQQAFMVTVNGVNDPPTATGDGPYFAQHDQLLGVAAPGVLGNDTDPDVEPLTATLASSPSNGSIILNPDGSFDYTPSGGYTGPDSFTYDACDAASSCSTATVTISVVNTAPVAGGDTYNVQHDQTLSVPAITGVLSNDSDADPVDTLTAVLTVAPANGSVFLNADGSFDYTPSGGFSGTDSFTYEAEDGDNSTSVTATVTINVVNGAPVAVSDGYGVHQGTTLTIDAGNGVLSNDSDPDVEDTLSAVLTVAPANGAVTLNLDGSFEYTPAGGFSGTDTFTYEADDGDNATTVTATVTINVTNAAPVATADNYSIAHDTTLAVDAGSGVLSNDSDPDVEDTLSAVLTAAPANGAVTLNLDGSFEYTPSGGFSGADTFTYEAEDGDNNTTVTATVTINVTNGAPLAFDDGCSLPPCAAPSPSGTLAWYAGDGDTTDVTGQYDGTATGALSFPLSQVGPGFAFNGTDTGVALAPGSLVLDRQEFSFGMWLNPAATQNQYAIIIDNNHSGTRNWVVQQVASNTNQYLFGLNDGSPGITFNLQPNAWQHLTATRKANVNRVYINGIEVAGSPVTGGAIPIGNASTVNGPGAGGVPELHLGQYKVNDPTGGFRRWNGRMDEVQIFDRGLSAAEVKALYDAGTTGTGHDKAQVGATLPPGLTAWYRGQGNANDSAGTNEAALFGGGGFTAGTVGGAFAFDGVDDEAVTGSQAWGITTSATVAAWINTTDTNGTVLSLSHGDVLDELLLHVDAGKIAIFNHKLGNSYTVRRSDSNVDTGSWVFVSGVIDGGMNNLQIYVNGVPEPGVFSTVGSPSNLSDSTPRELRIGNRNHAVPAEFFAGQIDEVQLYGRALSPTEIRELYLAGAAGIRAVPGAFEVLENASLSSTVAAMLLNDADPDPDALATFQDTYFGPGGLSINGDGTFDYTPAAGFNGVDSFTYTLYDGVSSSAPATVYLDVKSVNDAPAGIDNAVSFDEDGIYTFVPAEFGFSDFNDSPADAFAAVRIAQLPGNGTLFRGATVLSVGDFVSFSDINLGLLTFQPVLDHNGPVSPDFLFQVQDDGGTANGGMDLDPVARTMAIFVNPVNDPPAGAVVINGIAGESQLLSADATGVSDADGLGSFSYQWNRDGSPIPGAVSDTYLTDDPDVGTLLSVTVDYVDAQGNPESLTSADVGPIANLNDAPTGGLFVIGTEQEDQLLTVDDQLADGDGIGATTYEWFRDGVSTGVFGASYGLTDADVGGAMSVVASYTDGHGTFESVPSTNTTAAIANVNDTPFGQPAVTGIEQEDETLTADTSGISDDDGLGAFSYQWNRDGTPVAGETGTTYVLGDADVTTLITVTVSYTDGHGTPETITSNPTGFIANVNDPPQGSITILGTATEDETLTADGSGITDADGLGTFSYQWMRDGSDIAGEVNPNLLLGDADAGALVSVRIEYTDARGQFETVTSGDAGPVAGVNDVPVVDANNGLTVNEGSLGNLITTSELSASDAEAGELTYNVGPGPTEGLLLVNSLPASSFTQTDLVMNFVTYDHGGGEVPGDSFDFTVSDTGAPIMTSAVASFTITVNGTADAPSVSLPLLPVAMNQPTEIQPISVSDPDSASVTLTLNVAPIGALTLKTDATAGGVIPDGQVTGNGTDTVTVTATIAQLNATFAPLNNGLMLAVGTPGARYSGAVTISADIDDGSGPVNDTELLPVNRFELNGFVAGDASGSAGLGGSDFAGRSISGGGDFNGDGFDDYVIGAYQAAGGGAAYVVFGGASGLPTDVDLSTLDGTNGFSVSSGTAGAQAGVSVALNGDFNSDGLDDLLVGADGLDAAFLIYGRSFGLPASINLDTACEPSLKFAGLGAAQTGLAVSYAGDVNGDGASDLLIGAPGANGGAGAAYVVFGWQWFDPPLFPFNVFVGPCSSTPTIGVGDLDGTTYGFAMGGVPGDNRVGYSVASGDVNGDGFDDVLVGAPTDPASPSGTGNAFVVFGHAGSFPVEVDLTSLNGSDGLVLGGVSSGDRAGISVAAGDLNGDGFHEMIVGADLASPLARGDEGAAYVVYGMNGGFPGGLPLSALNGTNGFIVAGIGANDNAGAQVAFAGDVNGDGLGDLLVGAPLANPNGVSDAGAVSVVFGYPSGFPLYVDLGFLDGVTGFHVNGAAAGDLTGSVGLGGDLNGDGFDDLHIGAALYSGGPGRGYTVFGYDYRRAAAVLGGSGSAAAPGDLVIGSAGNDSLGDGTVAGTVLKGGAGDDGLFIVPDFGSPRLVDGGSGVDQLLVTSNSLLDLTAENQASGYGRYRALESVNLTSGSSLRVGVRDVLRSTGNDTLFVEGATTAPQPVLSNDAWLREGFDDGSGVAHYRSGYARLDVSETLNRDGIPVAFRWEAQTTAGNGDSGRPSLTGSGQFVVFQSRADNLVGSPAVPAGVSQIYMRNQQTGAVTLISQDSIGTPGAGDSTDPVVSYDGRYVAFRTSAAEFLGGPPTGPQVVIVDTTDGTSRIVSDNCGECQLDTTVGRISLSADARYVAFIGRINPTDAMQVYRMDLQTGTLGPASVVGGTEHCGTVSAPNACYSASISGDGRWVAWSTPNDTLANDTNGVSDVFLRDMQTGELRLVSALGGFSPVEDSAQPWISADGRRVAFESDAAFTAADTNAGGDIYIYDIAAQTLARASTNAAGDEGPGFAINEFEDEIGAPVLSGDGRVLMYTSDQSALAPAIPSGNHAPFVKALDCSSGCGIAGDGDFSGELLRGHLSRTADTFNGYATGYALSFDGRLLAMHTIADNVFAGADTNAAQDVYAGLNPLYAIDFTIDSDGDGLVNVDETSIGTNPLMADTDGDGLSDGDEYNVAFTDPTIPDTDGDGVGDGLEVAYGSDANAPQSWVLHVQPSGSDTECDGRSWAAWDGNTPALISCAFQTNAGVVPSLVNGSGPLDRTYVLYRQNANYGALNLGSGVRREFIEFVGSLDAGVYQPVGTPDSPSLLSAFVAVGGFPASSFDNVGDVTFHNVYFTGGTAVGGGINAGGAAPSTLVFEDVLVDGNPVNGDAGGVYVGNGSNVTLRRSKVSNNSATNASATAYGGGIMVATGALLLEDSQVSGNAVSGSGGTGIGGGIAVVGASSSLTLRNTAVKGNTADGQGGGVSVTDGAVANVELGSMITENLADGPVFGDGIGGGFYLGLNSSLTVEDSGISMNTAGDAGGGLYVDSAASLILDNAVVASNKAQQSHGGGLYLTDSGSTEIRHSRFLANSASQNGGGLYVQNTTGLFRLFDNLIAGNVGENFSLSNGGGLHYAGTNDGAQTLVHSNTIAYNQTHQQTGGGGGGAYFNQSANVDFIHNIFQFNDNDDRVNFDAGQNVADVGAGNLSFASNNIGGDSNPGGFDADPLFTQGFYLTQAGNASVDAGSNTASGAGLSAPFTTDPAGAGDTGLVDIGYHHKVASTGALSALTGVSASFGACGGGVVFTPQGSGGPLGPGRLIQVTISGASAILSSVTTLEPLGAGSRIAQDYGDGSYGVSIQGSTGFGLLNVNVYADDDPAPQTTSFFVNFSCG